MTYEPVIGLEVHVQLNTESKLFCGCPTKFGVAPNSQTCPVCLGHPGVLPVLNREAYLRAIKCGLALNSKIALHTKFDRKNYYYPDLPKNYQISQYDMPLCSDGFIDINHERIGITRVHLEEDSGKLIHPEDGSDTLVDLNRAGVPLVEIVSEPDMRSPQGAYDYLTELKLLLTYLDISTCNMEDGSLRCDVNLSLREHGTEPFGTKTEIKNLNSFKAVKAALEFEIERQTEVLVAGGEIVQETRLWDSDKNETRSMRSKEQAHDYRYFPEPDLPPYENSEELIESIKAEIPELPSVRRERFVSEMGIPEYDAGVLVQQAALADYFENVVAKGIVPKSASNWIMGDLLRVANERKLAIAGFPVSPESLAGLINLVDSDKLNRLAAREKVFPEMVDTGRSAEEIVRERGLIQVSDTGELAKFVEEVVLSNKKMADDYRSGKKQAISALIGQVMKLSKGKANPKIVKDMLETRLEE